MMEDVSGRVSDDPETDDQAADGDDPFTGRAVVDGERSGFVKAKNLSTKADDHEKDAESESEPCHEHLIYRIGCTDGKREIWADWPGIRKGA